APLAHLLHQGKEGRPVRLEESAREQDGHRGPTGESEMPAQVGELASKAAHQEPEVEAEVELLLQEERSEADDCLAIQLIEAARGEALEGAVGATREPQALAAPDLSVRQCHVLWQVGLNRG